MDKIGKRILAVRRGMSRREFSERFGVNPKTLQRYEEGKSSPSLLFIEQLANNFGVSLVWLQSGEGNMYADKNVQPESGLDIDAKNQTAPEEPPLDATAQLLDAMQKLLVLTKENGELCLENERLKNRIAELERQIVKGRESQGTSSLDGNRAAFG